MSLNCNLIYLDIPWRFNVHDRATGLGKSADRHYQTMTLAQIKALPVPDLMAKNCAVAMWVTWPMYEKALEVAASWKLKYSTCLFTWAKLNPRAAGRMADPAWDANWAFGGGFATRANTEFCLYFRHGAPKILDRGVRQLIVAPRRAHSQKPDEAYGRLERLFDGTFLEMFARRRWSERWDVWGNQIESTVQLVDNQWERV